MLLQIQSAIFQIHHNSRYKGPETRAYRNDPNKRPGHLLNFEFFTWARLIEGGV